VEANNYSLTTRM